MATKDWLAAGLGLGSIVGLGALAVLSHRKEKKGTSAKPLGVWPFNDTFDRAPSGEWNSDDPYAAPKDEDDATCLVLGRKTQKYTFGKYQTCLSENQLKTLFKGKKAQAKKLGCGVFACAYSIPGSKTKVVKFTRDSEDVAALIKAQNTGVVPKLYNVYQLQHGGEAVESGEHTPVYAMILERLNPLSKPEQDLFNDYAPDVRTVARGGRAEICGDDCGVVFNETVDAVKRLRAVNIEWTDIHAGNIGLDKNNNVKILDLGVSKTKLEKQPDILNGMKNRKLGRLLPGK